MKKILITLLAFIPGVVMAATEHSVHTEPANIDLTNTASLQRGFELFQNNCSGCHSTKYQRYARVGKDLNIPLDDVKKLIHTGAKPGELMKSALVEKDAAKWFGAPPPDLTLVARVRGEDWVYSYLKGFYKDPSRPFGVNNTIFPSVGMPHALASLQGTPIMQADGTIVASGGKLSAEEYDQVVKDITGFLVYSADPVKLERERLGKWVLGFLFIFFIVAYLLKKEYWKDVH